MRCRFGLKRRFVATIECDRLFPVDGFFPQIAQTLDMRLRMVARDERGLAPQVPDPRDARDARELHGV